MYVKAIRKGQREAELLDEMGWKQKNKPYRNKGKYTRKFKHKKGGNQSPLFCLVVANCDFKCRMDTTFG